MKNLIVILLVGSVGVILAGCATADAVLIDTSRKYPPTESVAILLEDPEQPYEVIAILEGNGSQFNNQSQVIKAIQKKARKIGAHAIYLISSGNQYVPPTYTRNFDGSLLTIPGGNKQMVKAIAIRFTTNCVVEPFEFKKSPPVTVQNQIVGEITKVVGTYAVVKLNPDIQIFEGMTLDVFDTEYLFDSNISKVCSVKVFKVTASQAALKITNNYDNANLKVGQLVLIPNK